MPEPTEATTPDPKIAELEAQNATLTATLSATRSRVDAANSFAKAAGSAWDEDKGSYVGGLDFRKARKALERMDEFSKFDPEKQADELAAEKVKIHEAKFAETLAEENSKRDKRIADLSERLSRSNRDDRIQSALLAEKAIPGKVEILSALALTRVRDDPETLEPIVLTAKGEVDEYVNTETGKLQRRSIEELAAEFKKSHPELFLGTESAGGGAEEGDGDATPSTRPISEWTVDEKSAYIEKHGIEKWQQLLIA